MIPGAPDVFKYHGLDRKCNIVLRLRNVHMRPYPSTILGKVDLFSRVRSYSSPLPFSPLHSVQARETLRRRFVVKSVFSRGVRDSSPLGRRSGKKSFCGIAEADG